MIDIKKQSMFICFVDQDRKNLWLRPPPTMHVNLNDLFPNPKTPTPLQKPIIKPLLMEKPSPINSIFERNMLTTSSVFLVLRMWTTKYSFST
jgi:hypothetical protein